MKKFEKRMVKEYTDLCKKIDRLRAKIEEVKYDPSKVSDDHYRMMRAQFFAMCAYEGVLRMRIEDLGIKL